ncbi:TonB family protein [Brevundimonas albigilva]
MQSAAGYAVVECAALPDGRVSGCTVVEESEPGQGYGRMAIEAVARGRVVPKDPGSKVGTFRTTVRLGPDG